MTEEKKATLNLTFDNIRRGNFSDKHAMVDVYLDGKFISTYQWNPFWKLDTKDLMKTLKYNRCVANGWRNRDVEGVLGVDQKSAEINLAIWQGKKWGKKLSESYDKKITDIMFKYFSIEAPDPYDVESCLINDAYCITYCKDFEDFCAEMDYDTDSKKADEIYNKCKDIFVSLIQNIGSTKLEELHELHIDD